eukprot:gene18199-13072_t
MWREATRSGSGSGDDGGSAVAHCASVWDAVVGWYGSLQSTAALTTLAAVLQWPRVEVAVEGADTAAVDEDLGDLGDLEALSDAANDVCDTVLTVASAVVRRESSEAWQTMSQSRRLVALQQRLRVAVVRDAGPGGVQLPSRLLSIAGDAGNDGNGDDSDVLLVAKQSHRQRQKAAQLRLLAEFQRTGALPPQRALATISHLSAPSIATGKAAVADYRLLEDDAVSPEEKDTFLAMLRAAASAHTAAVSGTTASGSSTAAAAADVSAEANEATASSEDGAAVANVSTLGESARHAAFEALVRQLADTQITGTDGAHGNGLGDELNMVQRYDLPFTLDDLDEPGSSSSSTHARENVAVVAAKKLLVGRRGEQFVLQYFQAQRDALGLHAVTWMNASGESKLPYDLVLQFRDTTGVVAHAGSEGTVSSRRMFVEVKTRVAKSGGESGGWHISASELDAARQHGPDYALVLVHATSSGTRLFCIGLPRGASDSQATGLWPALMQRHEVALLLQVGA